MWKWFHKESLWIIFDQRKYLTVITVTVAKPAFRYQSTLSDEKCIDFLKYVRQVSVAFSNVNRIKHYIPGNFQYEQTWWGVSVELKTLYFCMEDTVDVKHWPGVNDDTIEQHMSYFDSQYWQPMLISVDCIVTIESKSLLSVKYVCP